MTPSTDLLPLKSGSVSRADLQLLAHACGLLQCSRSTWRRYTSLQSCYRNRYLAAKDTDPWHRLRELADRGFARRAESTQRLEVELFHVTEAGFAELQAMGFAPQGGGHG